jgi:hypothetical protein
MNSRKAMIAAVSGLLAVSFLATAQAEENYFKCMRIGRWTDCIVVPMANVEEDKAAKLFQPPAYESARLYIARPYTQEPKEKSEVFVDGKPVGLLGPLTYLVIDVPVGRHEVKIWTGDEAVIHVDVQSQQILYVQYALNLWLGTITGKTTVLDEKTGKERMLRLKKAVSVSGLGK